MQISNGSLSRRGFINGIGGVSAGSLMLGAGAPFASAAATAAASDSKTKLSTRPNGSYYIRNVRLESGFERSGGQVVGTQTELQTLLIENGSISKVLANGDRVDDASLPHFDAQGLLLLPAFRDVHIHLDKTFFGGPWRAVRPSPNGIAGRIAEERVLLPTLLPTLEERAEKLVALLQTHGSTFARSHCNVDPVSGLKNLEHLQRALARHHDTFTYEIVAFPQHGLLLSKVEGLMREAMKMGATHVGGLDPTAVDGDMDKSLETMVQIAVDHNAGIDIHLHEAGESGVKAIRRLIDLTKQAGLQGKVTISHAFALASLQSGEDAEMCDRLAEVDISIASSISIGKRVMPIPLLQERRVKVGCGTDSVTDNWSPFGTGDILGKAKLAAQLYGWSDEYNLSRALGLATGGITPLDPNGKRVWPKAGDPADCTFVAASCSAEAVARLPDRAAVLHRGRLAAGALDATS